MIRSLHATVMVGALLLLVVAGLLFSGPSLRSDPQIAEAGSGPGVLSGTVTDIANTEIADVLIEVIDGTNVIVGSDTTDINGDYSITSLPNATYTVKATPPVASGLAVATILNVVVSGNTIRDIVLVLPAPSTYSGTVRNGDGVPVPDMRVELRSGTLTLSSTTDPLGAFSIEAAPGQYDLRMFGTVVGPAPDNVEARWNINSMGTVDLSSGDVNEDLSTGDVKLTVNVQDSEGAAVPESTVKPGSYITQYTFGGRTYSGSIQIFGQPGTGADGSIMFRLPPTRVNRNFSITARPPLSGPGSDLSAVTLLDQTLDAGVDKTVTMTLLPPNTYSGTLRNTDGDPVPGMSLRLRAGELTIFENTDNIGAFSTEAAPGLYELQLIGDVRGPDPERARARWSVSADPTVDLTSGDVTEDLSTGDVKLTVNVQDPEGAALPDALVIIESYGTEYTFNGRTFTGSVNATDTETGAGGSITYRLPPTRFAAGFSITASPPISGPGSDLSAVVLLGQTLVAGVDKTVTITLLPPNTYSGTVRNSDLTPVSGMSVRLIRGSLVTEWESITGSDGAFSIEAAPAQYTLRMNGDVFGSAPDSARTIWNFRNIGTVDLRGGDVIEELSIEDVKLTVNVQDSVGGVVPDSLVSFTSYGFQYTSGGRTYTGSVNPRQAGTGADGSVTYRLAPTRFSNQLDITVTPPAGSVFLPFSLPNVTLDQDATITVVLIPSGGSG